MTGREKAYQRQEQGETDPNKKQTGRIEMALKIALAGNPNCGKTTMFNALTGANQYVGNWPGVTVEKKEGRLKAAEIGRAHV